MPAPLVRWLECNMSGAPAFDRVRIFRGGRIPFDWLPGFRSRYVGITLWNTIYLREPFELHGDAAHELLFHELVHVRQFQRSPIGFPLKYLFFLLTRGYRRHPAEIEARDDAAALLTKHVRSQESPAGL
jgi:hypothetical protein